MVAPEPELFPLGRDTLKGLSRAGIRWWRHELQSFAALDPQLASGCDMELVEIHNRHVDGYYGADDVVAEKGRPVSDLDLIALVDLLTHRCAPAADGAWSGLRQSWPSGRSLFPGQF